MAPGLPPFRRLDWLKASPQAGLPAPQFTVGYYVRHDTSRNPDDCWTSMSGYPFQGLTVPTVRDILARLAVYHGLA
jgi:hypothetical protein